MDDWSQLTFVLSQLCMGTRQNELPAKHAPAGRHLRPWGFR